MPSLGRARGNSATPPVAAKKATVDDFTILKVIGRGSFGKVFLVKGKADGKVFRKPAEIEVKRFMP